TAIMARPSTNQMSASTVRLSAPGCHIAPSVWRVSVLIRDIGDRRIERAHKIINVDECTIPVPAGAKCGSTAEQSPINDHRPARLTSDRRNGPSLVTGRFESLSCIRKFHLADAKQRPQLRPGNLGVTRDDDKQVAAVGPAEEGFFLLVRGGGG